MNLQKALPRLLVFSVFFASAALAQDQEGTINPAPPRGVTVDQVIQKFAEKEKVFKKERENYVYTQTVKVQTLDGDTVDGEYQQTVEVTFDDKGRRVENVTYAPQNTLQRVSMSREDFQDIESLMPFVLTSDEINDYNIKYVGQQQVDELGTYVFDISPKEKEMKSGHRYFDGRIWVDDRDFQIVKTHGKPVPETHKGNENLFPRFTTYREQIDGKYWFPTYTRADDTLHFKAGDVHIREIIKYTNYQRFNTSIGKITVNYGGEKVEELKADPLTKDDIIETLKGGTPATTMTEIVKKRGVNFDVNADIEQEIRKAGGDTVLIQAIENNKKLS
jgi:outer membrane lipoprotein-sorting protein